MYVYIMYDIMNIFLIIFINCISDDIDFMIFNITPS